MNKKWLKLNNLATILIIIVSIIFIGQFAGILSIGNLFTPSSTNTNIHSTVNFNEIKPSHSEKSSGSNLFSFLAIGDNCLPDAGYDYCDRYEEGDAWGEIMLSKPLAEKRIANGVFYVGGAYELAKASGTSPQLYQGIDKTWDDFDATCNYDSCPVGVSCCTGSGFNKVTSPFRYTLASVGQSFNKCTMYITYAETDDYWVWTGYGYQAGENCGTVYGVNCYDSSDCTTGSHCSSVENPSPSSWQSWACITNECTAPADKCVGTDYYQCSATTFKFINKGKVVGKCGVSCTTNSQCAILDTITNNTCTADNKAVVQYVTKGVCTNNACTSNKTTQEIAQCPYGCVDGVCQEINLIWLYIAIGLIALIIIIVIIWKNKR